MKMGFANPANAEFYRATTAASSAPVTLRRKRYACGAVITAKQLNQYGVCAKCVRTAAADMNKEAA